MPTVGNYTVSGAFGILKISHKDNYGNPDNNQEIDIPYDAVQDVFALGLQILNVNYPNEIRGRINTKVKELEQLKAQLASMEQKLKGI